MSTESRIRNLEALVQGLATAMGVSLSDEETVRTTAKVGAALSPVSRMAITRKGQKTPIVRKHSGVVARKATRASVDEIVIENAGGNRADGRMRLPAKMFGTRDTITVDGVSFTKLESDQNRSANFNPEILGGETGDTFTFTHVGGSKWTVEVSSGSRKRKAPVAKAQVARKTAPAKQVGRAVRVGTNKQAALKEAAEKFGRLARENAADGFVNENIPNTFEDDPRQYLTSRENAQAKRVWKRQAGITLKAWVEMLSNEVYG